MLIASLFSLVYDLWARPGAYSRVEHLKGVLLGQAPALPANTVILERFAGANTPAYYENS